jgi:superfamily II DNA or RNA helicase
MKLRDWQAECIGLALDKYSGGKNHFLALATPGAGKTIMASALANELINRDLVDIVICFSPSSVVCIDFSQELERVIGEKFDGLLGSKGQSLTYQTLLHLNADFWMLFHKYRVFVIFDEIHHCSGSKVENANCWGEQILLHIKNKAEFTLAMTGTPWRSDTAPIVLSDYLSPNNKIKCDYVYGLSEAIRDGVCRTPQIIAIDNDNICLTSDKENKSFNCFKDLLSHSAFPYQEIIQNENLLLHVIQQANDKLDKLRCSNPSAGGLIVAASVAHANQILALLAKCLNETATIITYQEDEPTKLIHQYKKSCSKWVVSVGMISEGTNIPRLQVTCHLTRIKTEMHFRQILGRNLRATDAINQEAFLYMPAEPKLVEYAYRVAQDIPLEANVVKFEKMSANFKAKQKDENSDLCDIEEVAEDTVDDSFVEDINTKDRNISFGEFENNADTKSATSSKKNALTDSYEGMMNIFGRFKQETLELGLTALE